MAEIESQEPKLVATQTAKTASQPSSGLSGAWRILILMSLVTAVVAATLVVVDAENYQRIRQEMAVQQSNVQKLQASAQQVDAQLIQQQLSSQNLLASLEQLRLSTNKDPISPVLVEVDYLARLAHYNAQYSGDTKTVLALLEAAERRVSSLSSPQLADVRGALVSSITALKGVKAVDIEGVMLRLNALSSTVADLPVVRQATLTPVASKVDETTTTPEVARTWKEKLQSSLALMKNVVVLNIYLSLLNH